MRSRPLLTRDTTCSPRWTPRFPSRSWRGRAQYPKKPNKLECVYITAFVRRRWMLEEKEVGRSRRADALGAVALCHTSDASQTRLWLLRSSSDGTTRHPAGDVTLCLSRCSLLKAHSPHLCSPLRLTRKYIVGLHYNMSSFHTRNATNGANLARFKISKYSARTF